MKLKEYQERTLKEVKRFLEQLANWREKAREGEEWLFDFAEKAWEKAEVGHDVYLEKTDGFTPPDVEEHLESHASGRQSIRVAGGMNPFKERGARHWQ